MKKIIKLVEYEFILISLVCKATMQISELPSSQIRVHKYQIEQCKRALGRTKIEQIKTTLLKLSIPETASSILNFHDLNQIYYNSSIKTANQTYQTVHLYKPIFTNRKLKC